MVGVPFGIVARQSGLDPLQVSGTSVLIFAGAAQFAAVDLIAATAERESLAASRRAGASFVISYGAATAEV